MAEFCVDCWKALNEMENTEERYVLSSAYELCEGCGEYKPVIVRIKRPLFWASFSKNYGKSRNKTSLCRV